MKLTRRAFIKQTATATAAASAGITLPGIEGMAVAADADDLAWSKAPCRFCGTGCGVLVGVKGNRVVATQADPQAEVNRGLNCVKGYFLSKIMYGQDRLTTPLLRMKDGKFDKQGEFAPVTWDRAFDEMARQFKRVLKDKGPTAIGMFGSGQWTIWEGYAAVKLMKAGFRSNNIDPNARHCMASAVTGFMRTFGMDEPMGCYDDIEETDAFVLWGSNMAEMHPVLWSRVTARRLADPNVRVVTLSTFEHRSFDLADETIVFTPQTDLAIMNYIANVIIKSGKVNREFVDKHVNFRRGNTDIGYGLRPDHPLQRAAKNAGDANGSQPITFDDFAKFVSKYDAAYVSKLSGVSMKRFLIPLLVLVPLVALLAAGLRNDPRRLPSALIGKPAPAFELPRLDAAHRTMSSRSMRGQVWVLNVWASWCESCRDEHPVLMKLAGSGVAPVYGLNYEDEREPALRWLEEAGNPYVLSLVDRDGRTGIDYGVYGVPETFVIDRAGVVRYRQAGPLTRTSLDEVILPLVGKLQKVSVDD